MNQYWTQSRWWRYSLIGAGAIILVGTIGFSIQFAISTLPEIVSLSLIILGALSLVLAGSSITDRRGVDRINQVPFIGLGLLMFGLSLLTFPATEALALRVGWEEVYVGVSGGGLAIIGLLHIIRPKLFAKLSDKNSA